MPSAGNESPPFPVDIAGAPVFAKNRLTLPQYRYAVRAIAVVFAVVSDALLIFAAAVTAALVRFQNLAGSTIDDMLLVVLPAFFLAAVALNCYSLKTLSRSVGSVQRMLIALVISAAFAFTAAFALQAGAIYSRLETGYMFVAMAVYLTLAHLIYKIFLDRLSHLIEPTILILGSAPGAASATRNVTRHIPSEQPNPSDPASLERAYALLWQADRIILAFDDPAERVAWAQFARLVGVDAEFIEPNLRTITVLGLSHWEGAPTLVVARGALSFGERALKRAMDLAISIPLLVLVGPFLLLFMLAIKLDSSGPALFQQTRVGRNNRQYQCYKLRTMYAVMADMQGNRSTARDDDRFTRVGRFLRSSSIDELPQLWNVIRGDMSLVGPRPHALGSVAEGRLFWEAVPNYWTRHAMRPGITGLAQVRGYRGATLRQSDIEVRVAADLEYINSWSIWLDLRILLQTIRVVFHRNAF